MTVFFVFFACFVFFALAVGNVQFDTLFGTTSTCRSRFVVFHDPVLISSIETR